MLCATHGALIAAGSIHPANAMFVRWSHLKAVSSVAIFKLQICPFFPTALHALALPIGIATDLKMLSHACLNLQHATCKFKVASMLQPSACMQGLFCNVLDLPNLASASLANIRYLDYSNDCWFMKLQNFTTWQMGVHSSLEFDKAHWASRTELRVNGKLRGMRQRHI